MNPKISIIVPCYNQAHFLDECLQSVLEQTFQDWECIIVNDGSPDNTENIAKKWLETDSRFHYLYKDNGGLSSARNAGIKTANGEWLLFLDCDDIIENKKLEAHSRFFNQNIDIIISGYRYFESSEGVNYKRIFGRNNFLPEVYLNFDDTIDIKQLFKIKNPFVISAPLYHKDIFKTIGFFDERLKSLEDWEFNLRCVLNDFKFQHIGYEGNTKTLIRLHDSSMMRDTAKMNQNYELFLSICYSSPKYVETYGKPAPKTEKPQEKQGRKLLKLLIPPIFIVLKNKILYRTK